MDSPEKSATVRLACRSRCSRKQGSWSIVTVSESRVFEFARLLWIRKRSRTYFREQLHGTFKLQMVVYRLTGLPIADSGKSVKPVVSDAPGSRAAGPSSPCRSPGSSSS
ncbi:hypothetical protein PUN28_008712 [Cardiocondyla obscurior]|uniref:Uncharacterized protein n=1 Tax=Cardiocondyla obscurior TaxID=286306 RepID=A0AAW2G453_9HYME